VATTVDDLGRRPVAARQPPRPGPAVTMTDNEVRTVAVVGPALGRSERAVGQRLATRWRASVPRRLSQSACHRRLRDLTGVLVHLVPQRAPERGAAGAVSHGRDGGPVPLAKRGRGARHRLVGEAAALGGGGSDREW
jgi:hypothetical protein